MNAVPQGRREIVPWSPADDAMLRAMWDAADSVATIAGRLGRSRGAIYMHAKAIGLRRPKHPGGTLRRLADARARGAARSAVLHAGRPGTAGHGRLQGIAPFIGVQHQTCQWIEGEPSPDDGCKCGSPVLPGLPYCGRHAARAYRAIEMIEAEAA